ncbi:acyl-CoA dehydrogenase family protein [Streptomyces sp. NPDC007872]|uniref:acyl-CoA dehydrogenase family protein n=1 Tax=Streptomyces sp. NPDC007872 TaxID=3364782 RepID=UPI0036819B0C
MLTAHALGSVPAQRTAASAEGVSDAARTASAEGVSDAARAAAADSRAMEEGRTLTPRVAAALTAAGFPRHFVPRRFGGEAGSFSALLASGTRLAQASASAAWCATLYAAHGRLAAYLPEDGQRDLWADSPDVRIAAAVVPPQGRARIEGDHWRLTGRWAYASGVDHADWVLLAAWTGDTEPREHRVFAVPRGAVVVDDTWRSLGLRGTGSNTVTARDVLVPVHRTFTVADLAHGRPDGARCHNVPPSMVASLLFAVPALGAALGALDDWQAATAAKRRADGTRAHRTPRAQEAAARSSAEVAAARHLLEAAARRADHAPVTALAAAENQRDTCAAVTLCADAVDRLFKTTGAGGLAEHDPVQQRWRDVTAVAAHAALDFDRAASAYAEASCAASGEDLR